MLYFDFHAHIVLKQSFEDTPDIDHRIFPSDVGGLVELCTDLPYIIESQIQTDQLSSLNDPVVIGCAIYSMESRLAKAVSKLDTVLKPESRYKLSTGLLGKIADEDYSVFTEFTLARVMNLYEQAPYFHLLTKQDFNGTLPAGKINIFFSVEGCHSLVKGILTPGNPVIQYDPTEVMANLDFLRGKGLVLSVNLTHMQQSNICNHAFGMQLSNSDDFYPRGNGLTDAGVEVVQALFNRKICVDVKHMSIKSRKELMAKVDQGAFTGAQPLLCTHSGFTGIPFASWPEFISYKKNIVPGVFYLEVAKSIQTAKGPSHPGAAAFNMTTINLFDEEIIWIVKHGGMIGLSMDRRILGYVGPNDDKPTGIDISSDYVVDKEFFSISEWNDLAIDETGKSAGVDPDDCVQLKNIIENTKGSLTETYIYFYSHVMLHIKHFLQVCQDAQIPLAEAQQHLAIGSDFDGLINPFINFKTCVDMPGLKKYLAGHLKQYLMGFTDASLWADRLDVPPFIENLFYQNGIRFITGFFKS